MKLGATALFVGFAVALAGCERASDDQTVRPAADLPIVQNEPTIQQPTTGDTAAIEERRLTGELTNVDLDARTFVVAAAEGPRTFRFTDEMEVTGASGAQGLVAEEGSRVNVHYREEFGQNVALSIELFE